MIRNLLLITAMIGCAALWWLNKQQSAETTSLHSSQPGLTMVIDQKSGQPKVPSSKDRAALQDQRKVSNKLHQFKYRNTMTQYPDGTRTGVVDPQHHHRIYASRDENGKLVIHEGIAPREQVDTGVAK